MKYIAVDCETTGIDVNKCEITEIAFLVATTEHPVEIDRYCWRKKNLDLLKTWKFQSWKLQREGLEHYPVENCTDEFNTLEFYRFVERHFVDLPVTLSGKNVGVFDMPFMEKLLPNLDIFHYRILEVGSLFGFLARPDEKGMLQLPSLSEIKSYCGFEDKVEHSAYKDALDVVRLVHHYFSRVVPGINPR